MATDPTQSQHDTPPPSGPARAVDESLADAADISAENGALTESNTESKQPRILIGSQRGEELPAPEKPVERDWIPVVAPIVSAPAAPPRQQPEPPPEPGEAAKQPPAKEELTREPAVDVFPASDVPPTEPPVEELDEQPAPPPPPRTGRVPVPNLRRALSDDLLREFEEAMGSVEMDAIVAGSDRVATQAAFELESQHHGRVLALSSEEVFVDIGGREQGTVPLRQFVEPPEVGAELDVIVTGFNKEDGLYDLMVPHAASSVENWDDLREGMVVEAKVTGHNSGGLECEVNHIRGFIPVSQISLYRVEDLSQFVDERFTCLVTEANRDRRNLVLSRRAILEREKEEAKQQLLESLQPGQIHEGVVRKLMDFGAFVDIGGVDGLIHISQLDWGRVEHPSEILAEGQTVKVKILKVDPGGNRISLGYRDMLENPWDSVESKYPVGKTVTGKVSKIMEFGAFVQLERGVEGLVHISEIAHQRVFRASDFVHEGDEVSCVIKSVDKGNQRIGLSIKDALEPPPKKGKDDEKEEETPDVPKKVYPTISLKGGIERRGDDGDKFGLKW